MTKTYDIHEFPMPNDRLSFGLVVASCYGTDDEALLLVLNTEAPFYSVVTMSLATGQAETLSNHANINTATAAYADEGGDI